MIRAAVALILAFSLASCSSALKKKCEGTNWFDYGEDVAKHGQRPASDSFVLQCEKEDAKIDHSALTQGFQKGLDEYCTPDFAYRLGRQGEFLAGDMCSGSAELAMKPRHEQGVNEYCQASNGEAAGATGKKYNQICPKELEGAFLPMFNQGRKKYLNGVIIKDEGTVQDLDREIAQLQQRRDSLHRDMERIEWERTRLQSVVPSSSQGNTGGNTQSNPNAAQIQQLESQRQNLQWEANRVDQDIQGREDQQRRLRQEIRDSQAEMATL